MAAVAPSRTRVWLPVLAWAAVIFAFSSIPSLGTGLGTWDLVLRKLAHAAEYGILAALLWRALGNAPVAVAAASLYGASDELHQAFVPGRQAAFRDWAVDTAGALLGVALLFLWRRRR